MRILIKCFIIFCYYSLFATAIISAAIYNWLAAIGFFIAFIFATIFYIILESVSPKDNRF